MTMKTITYSDNDAWLDGRRGKITGTRVKDLVVKRGTGQKKAYYELIAERIAIPRDPNESRIDRGHTLEAEAVERLAKETGLKFIQVDNELWTREENANIAYSPDGYVPGKKIKTACEIKCLNSATHIEYYIKREIPTEYFDQVRQAFVVNDDLTKMYFVMYDPSMPPTCDFFYVVVTRDEVQEEVEAQIEYQKNILEQVEEWVTRLTF